MELQPCLETEHRLNVPEAKRKKRRIRVDGPDGCCAWFVAFSACLINFVMAGLGRMSGIMYIAFMDKFRTDRQGAATPFSVRSSTRSLLGPAVGILGQKYGVRAVTVSGGVIGTLGAAVCFFAPDMIWITILWGGLNGIGTALTTTLPQVVIEQYFKKHRTTASGMAFSGGCVGAFLLPVLLEKLLFLYGLEGTFLIIAGIVMHTIPAAMILRKPSWLRNEGKSKNGAHKPLHKKNSDIYEDLERCDSCKNNMSCCENDVNTDSLRRNIDTIVQLLKLDVLSKHSSQRNLAPELIMNEFCSSEVIELLRDVEYLYFYSQTSPKTDQSLKSGGSPVRNNIRNRLLVAEIKCKKSQSFHLDDKPDKFQTSCTNVSTPDISKFQRKSIDQCVLLRIRELCTTNENKVLSVFPEYKKAEIAIILKEIRKLNKLCWSEDKKNFLAGSFYDISGETLVVNPKEKTSEMKQIADKHPNTFSSHFKTALKLHKNPLFLLICVCRAVHFITFVPVVTTIVDFSMDQGLAATDGKYVIGALSLGDLLGRLCLGWVTDLGYISLSRYMMVVMVLQGVSTAALPLMHSRLTFMLTLAAFGLFQGSVFIRHPICIFKYMKSHEQSIAIGCMNFFSGFLGFLLPLYIGYFRDTIGSYDFIFFINGFIGFFVGLLWVFEPYLEKVYVFEDQDTPEAV